jgi:hypothetical protein
LEEEILFWNGGFLENWIAICPTGTAKDFRKKKAGGGRNFKNSYREVRINQQR